MLLLSKSMAVVVRCSSSRPNSNEIFRQSRSSPIICSRKIHLHDVTESGVKALLPRSMAMISKHLNEVRVLLKSQKLPYLPLQGNRISFDLHHIVDYFFAHQGIEPCKFPVAPFFMANALMLTLPFEALAETCEASNSPFDMPILLGVALIGATVGGLLARQRKVELTKLNEQLRQINAALRKQAKIESYAPSLRYAPVGSRIPEDEIIVDSRKHELISRLKTGKNFLRTQEPGKAFEEFKAALEFAQSLKDPIEEKKAARGLGACLQRLGKYKDAIKYHSLVLEISEREGEDSGNTEAYGAIADCYTELGDLEQAGKFYDKYILRLED